MKLVVVESPAKAKTIEKYLGSGRRVLASFGHVRDLPPKDGSVDPDDHFAMQWQVSPDRAKQLRAITDEARKADTLILATDPDREGEIEIFKPQEYWQVSATFEADGQRFTARLAQLDGKKIDRLTIGGRGDADNAKAAVEAGRFTVSSVETKPFSRNPPPPFTTSTLQEEAARKLGFSASHTMRVAQSLYEDGLITYMRTDGVDVAPDEMSAARRAMGSRYD